MTDDIERYLNIRTAGGASFGPEGERLAFQLDTTGVSQVWTLAAPREWPTQRTFFEERVTFVDASPTRQELVVGRDVGGNERQQFFRVDLEDGRIENLTGMPEAKHRWGGWRSDGDAFAFASNRREEAVFDVYVQDRDDTGDAARLVAEGDGWLSVAGWGPDDEALLVAKAHSTYDNDLYVVDVETGDRTHLTPHEGAVRFHSAEWAPDGEGVYCCTDRDRDTLALARIDVETGAVESVHEGGDWNVGGVTIHQESGRLVYGRNVEGYTELTAAELTGPTDFEVLSAAELPDGVAGGVDFGPDAGRYAVTAMGDTTPADVYVVDADTGTATRWTAAPTAGIPPETFRSSELVHYGTFDDREIPAFLTLPDEVPEDGAPAVVSIHGGPEGQRRPSFGAVKQYFLGQGYAYVEPNVRGSSGYGRTYAGLDDVDKRMDSVRDVGALVEWIADHPELDDDRLAVMGGSYGGFMVLAAMTEYPEYWAAGVDIVGIANFVTFLENTGDWRRELREAEYGSLEDDREFLESISPINRIEDIAAPLFVLHGENDPRVPVGEAEQVAAAAEAQGVPVRTLIFEDEGHGFSKLENRIEAYSAIAGFLEDHVRDPDNGSC